MSMYHRGKRQSPYRKRQRPVNVSHNVAGIETQTLILANSSGLVETKSWRGHVTVHGDGDSTNDRTANGWMGFYRGQLNTSALEALPAGNLLAMSEIIGVQPWTEDYNDMVVPLDLVGITLSVGEHLVFVSACSFISGGTARLNGSLMFAEKEIPA